MSLRNLHLKSLFYLVICFANPAQASLQEAEKAYANGDFAGALSAFEHEVKLAPNQSALLYNLGNAAYRSEQLGKAVAAYLAARDLAPRDPDIAANLEFVLKRAKDKIATERSSDSWHTIFAPVVLFSAKELWFFATLLWFVGGCGLAFALFRQIGWSQKVIFSLLIASSFYVAMAAYYVSYLRKPWAAVCKDASEVRTEPGAKAGVSFSLHEGAPVLIATSRNDWTEIDVPSLKSGWIDSGALCRY